MNYKGKGDPPLVYRKIAFLGVRSVGKTSIIHAFVNGTFLDNYVPTIETTCNKTIRFRKVHFNTDIVDTAGMDEYSRLSRNASLGVHGYALMFSIANRKSFLQISAVNDLLLNTLGDAPDVPRILVGSMSDLSNTPQRQVSYGEAQQLADSWGVPYIECSSKDGTNAAEVFFTIMREIEKDSGVLAEAGEAGCFIL